MPPSGSWVKGYVTSCIKCGSRTTPVSLPSTVALCARADLLRSTPSPAKRTKRKKRKEDRSTGDPLRWTRRLTLMLAAAPGRAMSVLYRRTGDLALQSTVSVNCAPCVRVSS